MKLITSFWTWLAACVMVISAAFISAPSTSSLDSRIAHLETLVKCPSCDDISVGVSNSTSAIAVRHEIVASVKSGKSDTEILTSLENRYGTQILLSPSTSGIGTILWLGPLLVVLAIVFIGLRLRGRTK
jgi:cytochrome c-type biogenesis protein CcmH